MRESRWHAGAAVVLGVLLAGAAAGTPWAAQPDYPLRPIELVAPFPPGGPADLLGRALAQAAQPHLGQPLVVVNKPGGGGTIGTAYVARAKPDGYTVLIATIPPTVIQPHLVSVPYSAADFIPVAQLTVRTLCLAVKGDAPLKALGDVIERARRNPGRLIYTTVRGTVPHLVAAGLAQRAGIRLTHLPQAGDAPAIAATLGGNAEMVVASRVSLLPHLKAGTLRALAVFNEQRDPLLPEVPTARELGFDVVGNPWSGVAVVKGTPDPIVRRWDELVAKIVADPAFVGAMKKIGEDIVYLDRAAFGRRWFGEPEIYGRIIREIGLTAQ